MKQDSHSRAAIRMHRLTSPPSRKDYINATYSRQTAEA
jgi:hypothetical protein